MPNLDVDVLIETKGDIEVFCSCGSGMCQDTKVRYSWQRHFPQLVVRPCQECVDNAYERGYQQGYDDARAEIADE